jgi:adenylate kinase
MKNLILLGAPGSGKGTLAVEICPKLGLKHISTGDLLREVIASGSVLGKEIKSYVDKGALVPDEVIGKMMKETLASDECKKGVLLDGFPRTVPQAEMLDEIMAELGTKIDHVIYINVDLDIIVQRIVNRVSCKVCGTPYHLINMIPKKSGICDKCGGELIKRADDNEETVNKRYNTFLEKTQPLMDYYKQKGLLKIIDGTDNPAATLKTALQIAAA